MKDYKYILFDLDGTLTDPSLGITNAVMYALAKYNISVADRRELYGFIGPPLLHSFTEIYGFSEDKANEAVGFYREYYADKGIFENRVYDGIENLLKSLKADGKIIILATSKPVVFAEKILDYFDLAKYFSVIAGSELDGKRVNKDEVIAHALEKAEITDKSACIMVGDREHDIIGANKNQIDSMGVLFGFGSREELEKSGATYICETVEDVINLLL